MPALGRHSLRNGWFEFQLRVGLPAQNAPSTTALTKTNAAQMASTFSFKARSTSKASIAISTIRILTEVTLPPKAQKMLQRRSTEA